MRLWWCNTVSILGISWNLQSPRARTRSKQTASIVLCLMPGSHHMSLQSRLPFKLSLLLYLYQSEHSESEKPFELTTFYKSFAKPLPTLSRDMTSLSVPNSKCSAISWASPILAP